MAQRTKSIYNIFWDWIFDKNMKTPLPEKKTLTNYKSPIHASFLLKSFMNCPELNSYLNKYMNTIYVMRIDKIELFNFIKQCVIDFKIKRKDILFIKYNRDSDIFTKIREKNAFLKPFDIGILSDIINKSNEKDKIYESLNISKKPSIKKIKTKSSKKISLEEFLTNFTVYEIEESS